MRSEHRADSGQSIGEISDHYTWDYGASTGLTRSRVHVKFGVITGGVYGESTWLIRGRVQVRFGVITDETFGRTHA